MGNRRDKALRLVKDAIQALDAELAAHGAGAGHVSTVQQLQQFRRWFAQVLDLLQADNLPPAQERYLGIAHVIVDSWPLGNILGETLVAAEHAYLDA